ncbi:MAG: BON domain-containing protein [Gemmatimonadota bacterium]
MKTKLAATCLMIGSILVPVASFAMDSDSDRSHPATFVKDSVITAKIKAKLASEHLGSAKHIKVETDRNGIVWLSGTTNNQEELDQAITIARNTEGVKSVNSSLKVEKDR